MTRSGKLLATRIECAVPPPANARNPKPCGALARYRVVNLDTCGRCLPTAIEDEAAGFVDGTVPVTLL